MRGAIERHGGTVEKFIGDAVVAVFGIPDPARGRRRARGARGDGDARMRSVRSTASSTRRGACGSGPGSGVNSGEVVATDAGGGQSFMTGGPVNLAARLEQAAGVGEILLGEATLALVRDAVTTEPVGALPLKGLGDIAGPSAARA